MTFIQCSMCRRAAAWVIDKEVFCEGHKEVIIETFGVDHFPIHRLTNKDDAFAIGGRFPKPNPKEKWRQRLLEVMLDAESRRNPRGARDLQYSAAPGDLLRELQHDLELPALSLRCL